MEVLNMVEYQIQETQASEGAYGGNYHACRSGEDTRTSSRRLWDRVIRVVCTGCGETLGRYENERRLAFCYECRSVLFPETIVRYKSRKHKASHGKLWEQGP